MSLQHIMSSRLISFIIPLLFLSNLASAQTGTILDHSKLPACAFQCPTINAAQSVCVPPAVPPADQGTYQTCFCNSAYLATFRAGQTTGVCDGTCNPAQNAQIQQWYQGLCTGGVVVIPAPPAVTATSTLPGNGATSTAGSINSNSSINGGNGGKTWIQLHYGWVIMVIILILAAIGGVLLGLWLKRRYHRKKELIHRDSMLRTSDAAGAMRNPHPPSSVTQMPRFRDSSASLGIAGARGGPPGTSGTGATGRVTSGTGSVSGGSPSTPASASERRGKARAANVLEGDVVAGESVVQPKPDVGRRPPSRRT